MGRKHETPHKFQPHVGHSEMVMFLVSFVAISVFGTIILLLPIGSLIARRLPLNPVGRASGYLVVFALAVAMPFGLFYFWFDGSQPRSETYEIQFVLLATSLVSIFSVPISIYWFWRKWDAKVEGSLYASSD